MMSKLAQLLVVLSALAARGPFSTSALADKSQDSGSFEATYVKRDMQPVPDQEGHVLMLTESKGTASNPGGEVDGFSVTGLQILDLVHGTGPQKGYVIYTKGADQRVVKIDGMVTTTMKDGQPNTTFEGSWEIVSNAGSLADAEGAGTYSGYFTAEDSYRVDWQGMVSRPQAAAAE